MRGLFWHSTSRWPLDYLLIWICYKYYANWPLVGASLYVANYIGDVERFMLARHHVYQWKTFAVQIRGSMPYPRYADNKIK